ncbi:MAG TPA: acyl carrier protein, partial [Thermoleophilaceae bacterium]
RIAAIVAEALGRAEVDPAKSLLELGASSLDLIRIAGRVERELGEEVGVDVLFTAATVAEIGARLGGDRVAA